MTAEAPANPNRWLITTSIMLATVMTSLDATIANVALPHMAGALSASADEITWVLTSYIIASAIMMPVSGWLARRLGRKRVFMISIAGFTLASALCGAAGNLGEIVVFRLMQGAFGAALIPLSQSVLLDIYSPEEFGSAMAIWGMGVVAGPIFGPALGGWLTDNFSWRWVFYINLPLGGLAFAGVVKYIHGRDGGTKTRFDFLGFLLLSVGVGGLQLMLDRGSDKAWFESSEIWIEAAVAALALGLFVFHTITADRPFLPRALAKDGTFVAASVFGFSLGVILFSTMALLPPMLETLMGYPVTTTGLILAPRGLGSLVSMFLIGQLVKVMDMRLILLIGLTISVFALYMMTGFSLAMEAPLAIVSGVIQGLGLGMLMVPLSGLAFATLSPSLRDDGAGVFTLIRNLGSSVGISVMQALHSQNSQVVHARLVEQLRPDNPLARPPWMSAAFSLTDPAGLARLNHEVSRQASMVAYIDDYRVMLFLALGMMPMLLLMRPPRKTGPDDAHLVIE